MLAKMIDKIVSLKETKIFEIDGQTRKPQRQHRQNNHQCLFLFHFSLLFYLKIQMRLHFTAPPF